MRPNFHVNISEQFEIYECMRPFFRRVCKYGSIRCLRREKKSNLVRLILYIGTGQSNNSKMILKWLRYDIFCNYLQHKKT